MKSVVYLDVLLLVNFLIAYFFLLAAGCLSGQRAPFWRLLLGSALAALSALILFAPELPYAMQLGYKLLSALLITGTAYGAGPWRRFAAAAAWYAALNMLLAGFALLYITETGSPLVHTANMAVYLRLPPLLLLALAALCSLAVAAVLRLLAPAEAPPPNTGLEVELCATTLHLRAVLDTGCHLKDPMTCLPVLLISYPDARARLPAGLEAFLQDWFSGGRKSQPPADARLRMIPCGTATGQALLPGFAVDHIGLITAQGVRAMGEAVVAFSPRSLGGNAYEALYGADFLPLQSRL